MMTKLTTLQHRHHIGVVTALAIAICVFRRCPAAEEALSGDDTAKQYVLMLCDGFAKNRDAFKQFTCRFSLVCGRTECPGQWWQRDAWDAEVTAINQTAEGLLVRDGNVFRYKLMAGKFDVNRASVDNKLDLSVESSTGPPGVRGVSFGCFGYGNQDTLFDDEYVISDLEIGPQVIISPINECPQFRSLIISPWQPGSLSPGYGYLDYVRYLVETDNKFWFQLERDPIAGIAIIRRPAVNRTLEYYVDETRGFLPRKVVQFTMHGEAVGVSVLYTEVREIGRRRWFPMKWTVVSSIRSENKVVCSVMELRVTELTTRRPKAELVTLRLPKGRRLIDQTNLAGNLKPLVIPEDTVVGIKDVPKLLVAYRNPARSDPPRKPLWRRIVMVACGIVLAASVGYAYYYYRYRRAMVW